MNTRIKKLRLALGLTQSEFAGRIGLKQNSIALIESGKRNISDQAILSICREFGVNEAWLRSGEGETFIPTPTSELDALAARYPSMTHETYVFIEKLVGLSEKEQTVIMNFLRQVVSGFGDVAPGTFAHPSATKEMDRDDYHALLDAHLDMEKVATEESEVS